MLLRRVALAPVNLGRFGNGGREDVYGLGVVIEHGGAGPWRGVRA